MIDFVLIYSRLESPSHYMNDPIYAVQPKDHCCLRVLQTSAIKFSFERSRFITSSCIMVAPYAKTRLQTFVRASSKEFQVHAFSSILAYPDGCNASIRPSPLEPMKYYELFIQNDQAFPTLHAPLLFLRPTPNSLASVLLVHHRAPLTNT